VSHDISPLADTVVTSGVVVVGSGVVVVGFGVVVVGSGVVVVGSGVVVVGSGVVVVGLGVVVVGSGVVVVGLCVVVVSFAVVVGSGVVFAGLDVERMGLNVSGDVSIIGADNIVVLGDVDCCISAVLVSSCKLIKRLICKNIGGPQNVSLRSLSLNPLIVIMSPKRSTRRAMLLPLSPMIVSEENLK
jgi:hypothetical protein